MLPSTLIYLFAFSFLFCSTTPCLLSLQLKIMHVSFFESLKLFYIVLFANFFFFFFFEVFLYLPLSNCYFIFYNFIYAWNYFSSLSMIVLVLYFITQPPLISMAPITSFTMGSWHILDLHRLSSFIFDNIDFRWFSTVVETPYKKDLSSENHHIPLKLKSEYILAKLVKYKCSNFE